MSARQTIHCRGLLFDMDGILISSIGSVTRSWTHWANLRAVDPALALRTAHGRRSIETVALLRPDLNPEAENQIIEHIECDDTDGIEALPGVLPLLAALPANSWTVVTSATRKLAIARLTAAGIPLPARLITADDVAQGKPNPAPYLAGAALLGFAPHDCVVFEDAPAGVAAGKAAGATVIATTFSHTAQELSAADHIIASLTHIRATHDTNNSIALQL